MRFRFQILLKDIRWIPCYEVMRDKVKSTVLAEIELERDINFLMLIYFLKIRHEQNTPNLKIHYK